MLKIGFVTCADLSRYFVSKTNALFTHDDQIACDFLEAQGCEVIPVAWGEPIARIEDQNFDMLIVRSPWDYMDTDENRARFLGWLSELAQHQIPLLNSFAVLRWSLDKHYLQELEQEGVSVPPTVFVEPHATLDILENALSQWHRIVLKPCISAAAKDTFLINEPSELADLMVRFADFRRDRSFMVQPFLPAISKDGEWSCVFLNQEYSHAVLKLPKAGHWLVQDELGGSVQCLDAPDEIKTFAQSAFVKLQKLLQKKFGQECFLLYARVDVLPGPMLGELELVEPELFFLDRTHQRPNDGALQRFYAGIKQGLKNFQKGNSPGNGWA